MGGGVDRIAVPSRPFPHYFSLLALFDLSTRPARCGVDNSYLDEIVADNQGSRMFVCSDTDYCERRQSAGHRGTEGRVPHSDRIVDVTAFAAAA